MPKLHDDPILRVADAIGQLIQFWGFKRHMGRAWTLLYLETTPLSASDLGARLKMSAGSVSMTLTELQKWGVVKKAWVPGERRDYFEPETSIWKMVSRVYRERELVQIQSAVEVFQNAISALDAQQSASSGDQKNRLRFARDRISSLLTLARIGQQLLATILAGQPVDASPLQAFQPTTDTGDDDDDDDDRA